jgi:parvulin-like peptidyl-prolyl isomerase
MVKIRELRTSTLEEMRVALSALDGGIPFEEAVVRYSRAPDARATRGVTPFFTVTDRPPLGAIAAELPAGERFGPVRDSAGYVTFEVLEKRNTAVSGDSARREQAVAELMRMKQRRKQTLFVAQSAAARGFEIYDDRLAKVTVTSTSSVVYRFIGFGGRMFAVPFVQPDVEWISEEPPRQQILP